MSVITKKYNDQGPNEGMFQKQGMTPLMEAVDKGREDVVEALIKSGADLNAQNDQGETALIIAAKQSRYWITMLLTAANADLHIKNNDGQTALDVARQHRSWIVYGAIQNALRAQEQALAAAPTL